MRGFAKLLFILLILITTASSVMADESIDLNPQVGDDMITVLTNNRDNLFPITSIKEYFSTPAEALYSEIGEDAFFRAGTTKGKRNITLFANADGIRDYSGYDKMTGGYPKNFQLTMDVTVNDVYPQGAGGCFVGFTNYGVSAFSGYGDALMMTLLNDGHNASIYIKEMDNDAGTTIPMTQITRNPAKLTIIHLTEHTYFYINDTYAGQYHDGLGDQLQMIYGATVLPNGDTADCTFDNLVVRKVDNL